MADIQTLIQKYIPLFQQLVADINNSVDYPKLISAVMILVPDIVNDVTSLKTLTPDQWKSSIIQIVNAGMDSIYQLLSAKLGISQDTWTGSVMNYLNEVIDKQIDSLITNVNGKIVINQSSPVIRFWLWLSGLCKCTKQAQA
jgi:hypothetical protein